MTKYVTPEPEAIDDFKDDKFPDTPCERCVHAQIDEMTAPDLYEHICDPCLKNGGFTNFEEAE